MRTRSQRLLSMILALSMLLTFLPVSAFADDTPPPYAVSNADTPTLDPDNTYTDNGNTYTYSLSGNTATLTQFTGTGTTVKVPRSVTTIDGNTYRVTTIGENVFADYSFTSALSSVTLPDSIQTIEDGAFFGCSLLSDITIPKDLITIGHGAFYHCSKLTSITLPEGLTTIGDSAFASAGLTEVNLPNSITSIGVHAFSACTDLTSITLPDNNLTEVKDYAFQGANLETIDWPVSLTNVGTSAFKNQMDSTSDPSSHKPIKIITYHGTKAQWDEMASAQHFATTNPQLLDATLHHANTVKFDVGEHGTAPDPQVVQYDEKAEKPDDPTEKGFTFKGWYTESEGGTEFNFGTGITEDKTAYAHWEKDEKPAPTPEQPGTQQPGTTTPTTPPESTDKPGTPEKPNEPTPPEAPAVEEDDTAAIGYAAAAVTAAFVGWGAYRIGSEVYLKYLLPKDVLLPQNRIQLAELLWEDAGRPAPAAAAAYADVDADDADAQQAARWAVENGLLTLPDTEKPEEFAPYRTVSYAKSARAWNKAQQLKETAAR